MLNDLITNGFDTSIKANGYELFKYDKVVDSGTETYEFQCIECSKPLILNTKYGNEYFRSSLLLHFAGLKRPELHKKSCRLYEVQLPLPQAEPAHLTPALTPPPLPPRTNRPKASPPPLRPHSLQGVTAPAPAMRTRFDGDTSTNQQEQHLTMQDLGHRQQSFAGIIPGNYAHLLAENGFYVYRVNANGDDNIKITYKCCKCSTVSTLDKGADSQQYGAQTYNRLQNRHATFCDFRSAPEAAPINVPQCRKEEKPVHSEIPEILYSIPKIEEQDISLFSQIGNPVKEGDEIPASLWPSTASAYRYTDIKCLKSTAVLVNGEMVFHANHVSITGRNFVATQAPAPESTGQFWATIISANCRVSVDLTNQADREKHKSCNFIPSLGNTIKYRHNNMPINVENKKETKLKLLNNNRFIPANDVQNQVIISELLLNGKRHTHIHYLGWPDYTAVPPIILIALSKLARSYSPNISTPIQVNCSAGVGRSGSLITADIMMNSENQEPLQSIIRSFRRQRSRFGVQKPAQHKALRIIDEYARSSNQNINWEKLFPFMRNFDY